MCHFFQTFSSQSNSCNATAPLHHVFYATTLQLFLNVQNDGTSNKLSGRNALGLLEPKKGRCVLPKVMHRKEPNNCTAMNFYQQFFALHPKRQKP